LEGKDIRDRNNGILECWNDGMMGKDVGSCGLEVTGYKRPRTMGNVDDLVRKNHLKAIPLIDRDRSSKDLLNLT
jgi:hypothetical protein